PRPRSAGCAAVRRCRPAARARNVFRTRTAAEPATTGRIAFAISAVPRPRGFLPLGPLATAPRSADSARATAGGWVAVTEPLRMQRDRQLGPHEPQQRKALLLRVGIDRGAGGILAPIFPDGSFEYVPPPET